MREKQVFVVGMHLKPKNDSKSLEFFICVGITRGTIGIVYEQNPRKLREKKKQSCRRKLKVDSNDAKY